MNPQMFNSFLDGTKSAIEMAAIANAPGSTCRRTGLLFPPCGVDDLPHVLRPRDAGGVLEKRRHGRGGVVARARRPSGVPRPALGRLCRAGGAERLRRRLLQAIRAEDRRQRPVCGDVQALSSDRARAGISVLSAALRGEPTGQPQACRGDVAAVAKRDLRAGEMLDGEGGYTVWGKLMPAARKPRRRRAADRPRAPRQAEERRRPRRGGALERCRCAGQRGGEGAPRDGATLFATRRHRRAIERRRRGVEYRSFGKTDLRVSAIGFGCWEVGGTYGRIDRGGFDRAVHQAIDSGIPCFDTAEAYGMGVSEEALAEALGPRRNQVSIVTKFGTGYAELPNRRDSSRAPRDGLDRQEPATAAHRPCRCLSRPLAGPGNAARRDGDCARRHRPARQGPLYRRSKISGWRRSRNALRLRRDTMSCNTAWNMFDRRMQAEIFPIVRGKRSA